MSGRSSALLRPRDPRRSAYAPTAPPRVVLDLCVRRVNTPPARREMIADPMHEHPRLVRPGPPRAYRFRPLASQIRCCPRQLHTQACDRPPATTRLLVLVLLAASLFVSVWRVCSSASGGYASPGLDDRWRCCHARLSMQVDRCRALRCEKRSSTMCSAGSVVTQMIPMLADLHIRFAFAKAHFGSARFAHDFRYSAVGHRKRRCVVLRHRAVLETRG